MLPAAHRLTSPDDFRTTVRQGRRRGVATLVVHLRPADGAPEVADAPTRAGFVVSKAVGGAVVRNRVKRRLRHQVRDRLGELPAGARLVVRALPPSAAASSVQLGRDLDRALAPLLAPRPAPAPAGTS